MVNKFSNDSFSSIGVGDDATAEAKSHGWERGGRKELLLNISEYVIIIVDCIKIIDKFVDRILKGISLWFKYCGRVLPL